METNESYKSKILQYLNARNLLYVDMTCSSLAMLYYVYNNQDAYEKVCDDMKEKLGNLYNYFFSC